MEKDNIKNQNPPIKYTDTNFDKLSNTLRQNLLRRKKASETKKDQEQVTDREKQK
ncbi:MAG: hypothetical protein K0Q51_14 [Rickettsiaceae bacterium]|jgi:hypothetical protein|nr:hypothetical protein [Rickettsiaceae bacterium]